MAAVEEEVVAEETAAEETTATETKSPEYIGAAAGKYQWDDRTGGDADKDVQGEAISKYSWSDGKKTVSIYIELDGLDDVAEDAFKAESGETDVSLTIASVAGKQRTFKLTGLANEITGVKVAQKKGKNMVSLKLVKKEEKTWYKLLDGAGGGGGGDDDDDAAGGGMGGMGGMDMASMMGGMGGGMGGMDMASMMGGMGGMGM